MSETAFLVEDFQELLSAARFSANLKIMSWNISTTVWIELIDDYDNDLIDDHDKINI